MSEALKTSGPAECPKTCSECDGRHHYNDSYTEYAENEPDHPAAKAGCVVWYGCKHCDWWLECGADDE